MKYFLVSTFLWAYTLSAQVTTTNIDQTLSGVSNTSIDINGDQQNDFTFEIIELSANTYAARVVNIGGSQFLDNSTYGYPDAKEINETLVGSYDNGSAVIGTSVVGAGNFTDEGDRYLGITIEVNNETHYGWILLNCNATNDELIIKSAGYNSTADVQILAGATSVTSLFNQNNYKTLEVFPNPSNQDFIRVNNSENSNVILYDAQGSKILETNEDTIDVSDLDPGVYIISSKNGTTRFVKQ